MSTTEILTPVLFPSVGWFVKAVSLGKMRVGTDGWYDKRLKMNRFSIISANGVLNLTVPIEHTGSKKNFKDARIWKEETWQKTHLSSLKAAYNNAPFYEFFDYKMVPILQSGEVLLSRLIMESIVFLHGYLCPEIPLIFEGRIPAESEGMTVPVYPQVFDDRHGFVPDVSGLDLLFNLGPEAEEFLLKASETL